MNYDLFLLVFGIVFFVVFFYFVFNLKSFYYVDVDKLKNQIRCEVRKQLEEDFNQRISYEEDKKNESDLKPDKLIDFNKGVNCRNDNSDVVAKLNSLSSESKM